MVDKKHGAFSIASALKTIRETEQNLNRSQLYFKRLLYEHPRHHTQDIALDVTRVHAFLLV